MPKRPSRRPNHHRRNRTNTSGNPNCPTPHKLAFHSEQHALQVLRYWGYDGRPTRPQRAYQCPCGAWHLTSKPAKTTQTMTHTAAENHDPAAWLQSLANTHTTALPHHEPRDEACGSEWPGRCDIDGPDRIDYIHQCTQRGDHTLHECACGDTWTEPDPDNHDEP